MPKDPQLNLRELSRPVNVKTQKPMIIWIRLGFTDVVPGKLSAAAICAPPKVADTPCERRANGILLTQA